MREKANELFKHEWKRQIECGTLVYVLTNNGAYQWNKPCGKWSCDVCFKRKVRTYQNKISTAIPGPHVFITELTNTGRSLTQFVQRHVTGDYFIVKTSGGATLITRFKLPESKKSKEKLLCVRKSKDKFLNGEFAGLLRQPFTGGKKITSRKGEKKQNSGPESYGLFHPSKDSNDEKKVKEEHRKIIDEYKKSTNDVDRVHWITEHIKQIYIFPKGKRLIDDYR